MNNRGFYSLLALATVFAGFVMFLTLAWQPFIIRYARSQLQALVDDACDSVGRGNLPLAPDQNLEINIPGSLSALGQVTLELFMIPSRRTFNINDIDSSQISLDRMTRVFSLASGHDSQSTQAPQSSWTPPAGIDEFRNANNTLICFGRVQLNQGVFLISGLLGLNRGNSGNQRNDQNNQDNTQNFVLESVAAVHLQPKTENGWSLGQSGYAGHTIGIFLYDGGQDLNHLPLVARNLFTASLSHLLARTGYLRAGLSVFKVTGSHNNFAFIKVFPNQEEIQEEINDPFASTLERLSCGDSSLLQALSSVGDNDDSYPLEKVFKWRSFLGPLTLSDALCPDSTDNPRLESLFFHLVKIANQGIYGNQQNQFNNNTPGGRFNTIILAADISHLSSNSLDFLDLKNLIANLASHASSAFHIVLFKENHLTLNHLNSLTSNLETSGISGLGGENFSLKGRIDSRRAEFSITIFDPCSIWSSGDNKDIPEVINSRSPQYFCRGGTDQQNPNAGQKNPHADNYFHALLWMDSLVGSELCNDQTSNDQTRRIACAFAPLGDIERTSISSIFSSTGDDESLVFRYALAFYRQKLITFGWLL